MVMQYRALLMEARKTLAQSEGEQAGKIAREIVAFAAGKTPEKLLAEQDFFVSDAVYKQAKALLQKYAEGMPLAYILGEWSFYGLNLLVSPDVLIPRDDSMVVTDLALQAVKELAAPRVLDLCTGSGCIGLAIAAQAEGARVTLADISDKALKIAKENIKRTGFSKRVSAVKADALQAAPAFLGQFDVIVSNPPYILSGDMQALEKSVRDFEPHLALDGGEDGCDFYRAICRNYLPILKQDGVLCFEFGLGQEKSVLKILEQNNLENIAFSRDTGNIIRAVSAQKKERN